jgi:hypothetical protein
MIAESKRRTFYFVLSVAVVAFVTLPHARAQADDKERAEQEAAKQQQLEKNALKLLDEVVLSAESLKLPENRSYVLATAADLLWQHDEKRARTLFWEALATLNLSVYVAIKLPVAQEGNNSARPARSNGPTKEQLEDLNKYYAGIETRRALLQKVAAHDPQLALDMMRSTRQGPPPLVPGTAQFDPDADLEQELTYAAVANDSKRALQLAHESLAKGLTYQLLNLLRQVNQKDQDAGTQLAGDIIAKLDTENFSNNFAPFFAVQLLQLSRTSGAVLVATTSENVSFTRLKLDDQQKQHLVEILTNAALSVTGANTLATILQVMPEIEQYMPDRAPKLKERLAEYNRTLPPNQRNWNNFEARFAHATPEEMIRAINNVSEEQRRDLLYQAASKAVARGEADKYRELINSQIESETDRKAALDVLVTDQMYYDISHGKVDDLEKLLPLIRVKELRAIAMAQLAVLLEKKDQHDEAVKLLDEARTLVKVNLADDAQSSGLFAVMLGYSLVDPPKAFAMIEASIDWTNDEISKVLLLDRVLRSGATKNGEIILNSSRFPLNYTMARYSAGVVALGKADFDRTKGLADRFQRNELKVAARLMLVQALLRDAQSRTN